MLFVTHRLEEIRAITDRVTILRDGLLVDTLPSTSLSERDLIQRILGRSLDELYPEATERHGEVVLEAIDVRSSALRAFSVELQRGEILGLTGLVGMGYERVPYLLFGADRADAGTVTVGDRSYDLAGFSPHDAIKAGLALLPADRLQHGAVPSATVLENVTLPTVGRYWRGGRFVGGLSAEPSKAYSPRSTSGPQSPSIFSRPSAAGISRSPCSPNGSRRIRQSSYFTSLRRASTSGRAKRSSPKSTTLPSEARQYSSRAQSTRTSPTSATASWSFARGGSWRTSKAMPSRTRGSLSSASWPTAVSRRRSTPLAPGPPPGPTNTSTNVVKGVSNRDDRL